MKKMKQNVLTELEKRIIEAAQKGDIWSFCDALLEHPEDGRLLRTLALEDEAPEWREAMKRISQNNRARIGDGEGQS